MHLRSLRLINFRNYTEETMTFDTSFTAILGSNGVGKTNILEAIHYLCLTRGYSSGPDARSIRNGQEFFTLMGRTEHNGKEEELKLVYAQEGKQLFKNGKEVRRFADHIGTLPVVMVAPQDISLVWEAGEPRRRFFDQWMSQADRGYLSELVSYNHHLRQCNALLKTVREGQAPDRELLDLYFQRMAGPAETLSQARRTFLDRVNPVFSAHYQDVAQGKEGVSLFYRANAEETGMLEVFRSALDRDLGAGRLTRGPHRDEYDFLTDGFEVREFGSQGQQKSFLVALKLAAHAVIGAATGIAPILLLDDIFEKLDDDRTRSLLRLAGSGRFGQVILTDSSPERALKRLKEAGIDHGTIRLDERPQ